MIIADAQDTPNRLAGRFTGNHWIGNHVPHEILSQGLSAETSPFSKDQMDLLQSLFNKAQRNPSSALAESTTANVAQQGNTQAFHATSNNNSWIVDSGVSDHVTGNKNLFSTYSSCKEHITVTIAYGTKTKVMRIGTIHISETLKLEFVLYVPQLQCNLLSVRKLNANSKCLTIFNVSSCLFQVQGSERMIGCGEQCGGLYIIRSDTTASETKCKLASVENKFALDVFNKFHCNKNSEFILLHYRLGHPNFLYLARLFPSLFVNKNVKDFQCDVCQLAKHSRSSYLLRSYNASHHFSMIHCDIWGPSRVANLGGYRWFLLLVDDHTRIPWVFLMKEKSEASVLIKQFHVMVKTQFNTDIQIVHSDNAREFFNTELGPFQKPKDNIHQFLHGYSTAKRYSREEKSTYAESRSIFTVHNKCPKTLLGRGGTHGGILN